MRGLGIAFSRYRDGKFDKTNSVRVKGGGVRGEIQGDHLVDELGPHLPRWLTAETALPS